MAEQKKANDEASQQPDRQQADFWVEPGTHVHLTVEVGETMVDGKVPLTVRIEQVRREESHAVQTVQPTHPSGASLGERLRARFAGLQHRLKSYDLAMWLFIFAAAVYLITRLVGLTRFPIYFFTDEAIQTQSIVDLIQNGYRDPEGVLFPAYFRNGEYRNLGVSVYLQWFPYMLLGKSAAATRATSVVVTLIGVLSIGIILRNIFKMKHWWMGTLFLSITPAWFLHSRTAFETAEFVAFYAGAFCAYLLYRYRSAGYLYLALFLGALAFYTYSPGQVVISLTAGALLLSDWRYHWENRRTALIGLVLTLLLALPYLRFRMGNPDAPLAHLHTLYSYWVEDISFSEKLSRYFSEYGIGLSPWYWYLPNDRDLPRHLMKGYGNIALVTLPFALLGMAYVLRNLREAACRAVLIALLISPTAAALVQTSITRALAFVIPAAILTAIGFERVLQWIESPKARLVELSAGAGLTVRRMVTAALILLVGILLAFLLKEGINRLALSTLAILLALQTSGALEYLAQVFLRAYGAAKETFWHLSPSVIAVCTFLFLSVANVRMLSDALTNGPLWFRDYGMGGMQYGAFQVFDIIELYQSTHTDTKILFSPDWANGTDVVARFFLGDPLPIQLGSIRGHIVQQLPLDDALLFIMTPHEYDLVMGSAKFQDIHVETILPYPDGTPGFYFLRLRYVDHIDEVFAAERAARQVLQETTLLVEEEPVKVRYSYLDSEFQAESMALVFDEDPYTVAKTFEINPFVLELTFPAPRTLRGFSIIIGSANVRITLKCYASPGTEPILYTFDGQGTMDEPELSFDLPAPTQVEVLQVEVLDTHASDRSKVHIWELKLR